MLERNKDMDENFNEKRRSINLGSSLIRTGGATPLASS